MREMTPDTLRAAAKAANSNVPFNEGVLIERFNYAEVAAAIEHEVEAMRGQPSQKITLHMDAPDAIELARSFRKLALLGV